ncbi:MAG TPA: hypothetical protein VJ804_01150 [Acidimicrobiales bacterium]|nr:hypothetical protein [Acidimicrobiales bacterium]
MAVTDSSKVPGGWLGLLLGILVTTGLVVALVVAWPEDDERALADVGALTPTTRYGVGELPPFPELPELPTGTPTPTAQLFASGLPEAIAQVLAAAGEPRELQEIAVYPDYAIVTFRSGDQLTRAAWRNGIVATTPAPAGVLELADLFSSEETDLARIPSLVADAPTHYPVPVTVTHVLIDRFLPFDERVLVRVYASPPGDPSAGGYVSYAADGTLVRVCC